MRKMVEQPERGPKPFMGTIERWEEVHVGDWYCIIGLDGANHNHWLRTSRVLNKNGNRIETLNSIYELGKKKDA